MRWKLLCGARTEQQCQATTAARPCHPPSDLEGPELLPKRDRRDSLAEPRDTRQAFFVCLMKFLSEQGRHCDNQAAFVEDAWTPRPTAAWGPQWCPRDGHRVKMAELPSGEVLDGLWPASTRDGRGASDSGTCESQPRARASTETGSWGSGRGGRLGPRRRTPLPATLDAPTLQTGTLCPITGRAAESSLPRFSSASHSQLLIS